MYNRQIFVTTLFVVTKIITHANIDIVGQYMQMAFNIEIEVYEHKLQLSPKVSSKSRF